MGLPLLVMAKLQLLAVGHGPQPFIGLLVWPFILKLPILCQFSKLYDDFVSSSTFFLFRLGQIVFQQPALADGRWERAGRLLRESLAGLGRTSAAQVASDEASFLQASMIAL